MRQMLQTITDLLGLLVDVTSPTYTYYLWVEQRAPRLSGKTSQVTIQYVIENL